MRYAASRNGRRGQRVPGGVKDKVSDAKTLLIRRLVGTTLVVVPFVALCAQPSSDVNVTMLVTAAKQENSPMQIVGFKLPAQVAGFPIIVVHNATSKEIKSFGFMNLLGNPRPVEGDEPKWGGNLGGPSVPAPLERVVPPNATAEFPGEFLRSHQVGFWAHRLRSNCLHEAVWIANVKFADGSSWEWENDLHRGQSLWRESIRTESIKGCDDSIATQEELGRLDGGSWLSPPGPSHASTEIVPFYVLTCPVRDQVTKCPM